MSKDYLTGLSPVIPVSPGVNLATLLGCDAELVGEGILIAPGSTADVPNTGDITIVHSSQFTLCDDVTLKPGQTTNSKVFRFSSVTVYSENGTEKLVFDGVTVINSNVGWN